MVSRYFLWQKTLKVWYLYEFRKSFTPEIGVFGLSNWAGVQVQAFIRQGTGCFRQEFRTNLTQRKGCDRAAGVQIWTLSRGGILLTLRTIVEGPSQGRSRWAGLAANPARRLERVEFVVFWWSIDEQETDWRVIRVYRLWKWRLRR